MHRVAPRAHQQLERVVETGRIASFRPDHGLDAVDRLKPVIWSEGSDSASLDNALELLVRSGRDPVHALMMLVPEAHEGAVEMEPALRGFYEFHECLVEPWDGPAARLYQAFMELVE